MHAARRQQPTHPFSSPFLPGRPDFRAAPRVGLGRARRSFAPPPRAAARQPPASDGRPAPGRRIDGARGRCHPDPVRIFSSPASSPSRSPPYPHGTPPLLCFFPTPPPLPPRSRLEVVAAAKPPVGSWRCRSDPSRTPHPARRATPFSLV
ncbi:hypothetical protein PAHAL_1G034800 [Panicum hallii]|uniref:Uncharacterized protein n=1 Tax=Panicum hallii TaxID=206008 RepID=A0A2T8KTV2_9POAL|nr:hypothetical protein PAHAL_1G034800 [Panicum hallii]